MAGSESTTLPLHRWAELLGPIECRSIASALLRGADDFSMTIQGYDDPSPLLTPQPGDLVGWAGLVRRDPCEWLTAATPLG